MSNSPTPTVFVVDDYAPVRRSISRLLHAAGFVVAAFASAEEFLAQYDPGVWGCLVLDVAMPALNGLELQRILAEAGSLLPIIFLTGEGDIPKAVLAMMGMIEENYRLPLVPITAVNREKLSKVVEELGLLQAPILFT